MLMVNYDFRYIPGADSVADLDPHGSIRIHLDPYHFGSRICIKGKAGYESASRAKAEYGSTLKSKFWSLGNSK
jgi:hypothetical protein